MDEIAPKEIQAEYLRQIKAAYDDEQALALLEEYGRKGFMKGWDKAIQTLVEKAKRLASS